VVDHPIDRATQHPVAGGGHVGNRLVRHGAAVSWRGLAVTPLSGLATWRRCHRGRRDDTSTGFNRTLDLGQRGWLGRENDMGGRLHRILHASQRRRCRFGRQFATDRIGRAGNSGAALIARRGTAEYGFAGAAGAAIEHPGVTANGRHQQTGRQQAAGNRPPQRRAIRAPEGPTTHDLPAGRRATPAADTRSITDMHPPSVLPCARTCRHQAWRQCAPCQDRSQAGYGHFVRQDKLDLPKRAAPSPANGASA
jgi:hypothetical protein